MEREGPVTRRFVLDSMLGKTAKWLRLLGFDALCRRLSTLEEIVAHEREGRVPVTRNQRWCEHEGVVCLVANDPAEQVKELVLRLDISSEEIRFLSRCVLCNEELAEVPREAVFGLVPDYVFETRARFSRCPTCGKAYWRGSHHGRMVARFRRMVSGTRLEQWASAEERRER